MSEKVVPPRQQFRGQRFYIQHPIPNQQRPQTQQSWAQTGYSQQSGTNTRYPQQAYPQQSQWKQSSIPHYSTVRPTQYTGQFVQKHVHTPPPQFQQLAPKPLKRDFFNKKVPVPLWGIILASVLFVSVVITSAYATGSRVISPTLSISPSTSSSNPGGQTNSAPTTTSTFVPTTIPLSAPTSVSTSVGISKVGDTIITVDGLTCTLISVQRIPGDDIIYPKPGDMFIVVHVKLMNSSSSDYNYLSINFQVISGTGNGSGSIDVAPSTYTAKNQILTGTLIPGGTVQGDIIFEVTIGDHKAELGWQPDPTGSITENIWNLGL